jgi:hypothetical protein
MQFAQLKWREFIMLFGATSFMAAGGARCWITSAGTVGEGQRLAQI